MTVVLGPTRAYVQRDKLVTLQWSGLWDVISLQTLCWEIGDKSRSCNNPQKSLFFTYCSRALQTDRQTDRRTVSDLNSGAYYVMLAKVVEYRTRNREVAGLTHTRFTASNLEQVANLLCAQANSASYPCRDGKWVVAKATGWRPSVTDWGDGVSAPWVQLSVSAGSGWPHRPAAPLAHTNQLPLPRL